MPDTVKTCWLCETALERGEVCDCGRLPLITEGVSGRLPVFLVEPEEVEA